MEDVLDVYHHPEDPKRPLACFDETSKQLVKAQRTPIRGAPGRPERYDYEYERNGVCNLFLFLAPLRSWRHVEVTDRRTKVDWAQCMKDLVDTHFPDADRVTVVLDNLNTHRPSALYECFAPVEAKRILDRLEFHYTPKHGSWLNMAETEFSVLIRQSSSRRIPDRSALSHQIGAWQSERNAAHLTVDWQFTTADARTKLKQLYPLLEG